MQARPQARKEKEEKGERHNHRKPDRSSLNQNERDGMETE